MPDSSTNPQALQWLATYSRICAALIMATATLWLATLDVGSMDSNAAVPHKGRLHTSTAIALFLSGTGLLFAQSIAPWRRHAAFGLSLLVAGIGLVRLLMLDAMRTPDFDVTIRGQAAGSLAGIDIVAIALCALGALGALVAIRRLRAVKEVIAIGLLMLSIAGIASYAFTLGGKSGNVFSAIAIHKSIFLLAATSGWMAADPRTGFLRITTLDSYGGELARRLMVPSLLLPVALTFAMKHAHHYLGVSESLALTLGATMTGTAIAAMIWAASVMVHRGERHRLESETLRFAATRDALTGLFNRRHFDGALQGLFQGDRARDAQLSLLMLDADHFKGFNDSFGHPAGDDVLRRVGAVVRESLRPADMPARYGGEEFVIILPDTDLAAAERVAERICREIRSQAWDLRAVTVSIGVASVVPDDTPDTLLARADRALYRAKALGRDRVCLDGADGVVPIAREGQETGPG